MATKHPPQETSSDHPSSPTPPQGRPLAGSEPSSGRAEAPDLVDTRVGDNTQKPPEDWKTGDEPMTGAQRSYLKTLSDEAHVPFDEQLSKAEASRRIDELQQATGRGRGGPSGGGPSGGGTSGPSGGGARGSRQGPDAGGQAEADGQSASLRGVSDGGGS